MKTKHSLGPWHVRPDYGKENVYYLWDEHDNYHEAYTSPETMDANARLMESAPDLLNALQILLDHAQEKYPHFESERGQDDIAQARRAINKAKGKL